MQAVRNDLIVRGLVFDANKTWTSIIKLIKENRVIASMSHQSPITIPLNGTSLILTQMETSFSRLHRQRRSLRKSDFCLVFLS